MDSGSKIPPLKPILIAGPTASGKSGLALSIAKDYDGVIINADSSQVYRELQIISARPSEEDLKEAPHSLYGHCSGKEAYSTGKWLKDIEGVLNEVHSANKRPIIVGGTGLYFKCLTEGLSIIPEIDEQVRVYWRDEAKRLGAEELYLVLKEKDPLMADQLMPTDKQRIIRALEVFQQTGRSLKSWMCERSTPLIEAHQAIKFVLTIDRDVLYERINERFTQMIEIGAVDEVRRLNDLNYSVELPVMRALGVPEIGAYLEGVMSLDEATSLAQRKTRNYAKRQLTWLRRNMIAWNDVNAQQITRNLPKYFAIIDKNC